MVVGVFLLRNVVPFDSEIHAETLLCSHVQTFVVIRFQSLGVWDRTSRSKVISGSAAAASLNLATCCERITTSFHYVLANTSGKNRRGNYYCVFVCVWVCVCCGIHSVCDRLSLTVGGTPSPVRVMLCAGREATFS